jgi:hypothetical protein
MIPNDKLSTDQGVLEKKLNISQEKARIGS